MSRFFTLLVAACAMCVVCGCQTAQKATRVEEPRIYAAYAGGSPLHERPATAPVASADVEVVDVEAYTLANALTSALEPFAGRSTLITASGDSSIRAMSEELANARIGQGGDVAAFVQQLTRGDMGAYGGPTVLHAASAVGMTLRIEASQQSDISLLIGHDRADMLRVGLMLPGSQLLALSDVAYTAGKEQQLAMVLPGKSTGSLAYILKIRPPKDPSEAARAIAMLKPSQLKAQAMPTVEQLLVQQTLQTARENRSARRSAIVYLASQSRATICEDAAISADDDFLKALADELANRLADARTAASMSAIGWVLDGTAFDLLARQQLQKKLNSRLTAVLLMHSGEVGRSGSSLEQLIGKAASRNDLENRLIAENFLYLEDVSPAARIRAYDWLARKQKAPAGYDPLGSAADRKKAIDAALEEMAQQGGEKSK